MFNPIPASEVPTERSGNLLSAVYVQGYYLPGAETKRNGVDRFREDMKDATRVWGFPVLSVTGGAIHLTANDLGAGFVLPTRSTDLTPEDPGFRRLQNIHATKFAPTTSKIIAVFYAPFATQTDHSKFGVAFQNVPNAATGKRFQYIVIRNAANNGSNTSVLYHELGHIFYGTAMWPAPWEDRGPINNDCDPSRPGCTRVPGDRPTNIYTHSPIKNNLMFETPGNNTALTSDQKDKATSTFLLY